MVNCFYGQFTFKILSGEEAMQLLSVYASIVNFLRGFDPILMILIIFGLLIIGFLVIRKAIKVNYNPKKLDNINMAWLALAILIFALVIFMVVVYY